MGSIMIEENVVSAAGTQLQDDPGGDGAPDRVSAGYTPRSAPTSTSASSTREDTAELARKYRHALTAENRSLGLAAAGGGVRRAPPPAWARGAT